MQKKCRYKYVYNTDVYTQKKLGFGFEYWVVECWVYVSKPKHKNQKLLNPNTKTKNF